MRFFIVLLPLAIYASANGSEESFDKALQPYLKNHCERCHNAEKSSGEFRIDKLSKNVGRENNPQWLEVMDRINSSVSSGRRGGPSTRCRIPCNRITGGIPTRMWRSAAPSETTNCNKSDI